MGELVNRLEREGLLANTIVIYLSDHGDLASEHGLWWKRSYYEGSARVPLLLRLPGGKRRNRRISHPVELVDLFPTLCELAGLPIPEGLDGESMVPLLDPKTRGRRKKDFARSEHFAPTPSAFRMLRTPRWKYVEFPEFPPVLFDMANDPEEKRNLAGLAEFRQTVEELHARLWDDGESWASLDEKKQADIERAKREHPPEKRAAPNQYALPNGEIVDADGMLYAQFLKSEV